MKSCKKCGEAKPTTEFYKDAKTLDGLRSRCKACMNATNTKWNAANLEKRRAITAKCDAANREKKRAAGAKYRAANPEKQRERHAKYHAAHPERARLNNHNRRARQRDAGGKLSPDLAARLLKLQRGKCACCRVSLDDGSHLDHVIPLALEGPNEDWNMQLLCPSCNLSKNAKHPVDFMQERGYLI